MFDASSTTETTQFGDVAMHQLRRAAQAVTAIWQQHSSDLTAPQFAVLITLAEQGESDQTTLGALASIDRSTLSSLLDRLEDRGLIGKTVDPANRRRRRITLTEAGRRRLADAYDHAADTEGWIAQVLGETAAQQLVGMLRTLGDAHPGLEELNTM